MRRLSVPRVRTTNPVFSASAARAATATRTVNEPGTVTEAGTVTVTPRLADCAPAAALFIDDIKLNVEGARAFGWDAIQYTDFPALTADLRARGIEV